jgi:predicted enzyme related to lactoylglutathione lyase
MLTLGTTVLGVDDFPRAKRFWMDALGYVPRDPGDDTFVVLVPASGAGPHLALDLSETPVQEHPRVHLDLYADDQAAEIERLLALGAHEVDWDLYPDRPHDFVVLADTEGNRFCVIDQHFSPPSDGGAPGGPGAS